LVSCIAPLTYILKIPQFERNINKFVEQFSQLDIYKMIVVAYKHRYILALESSSSVASGYIFLHSTMSRWHLHWQQQSQQHSWTLARCTRMAGYSQSYCQVERRSLHLQDHYQSPQHIQHHHCTVKR